MLLCSVFIYSTVLVTSVNKPHCHCHCHKQVSPIWTGRGYNTRDRRRCKCTSVSAKNFADRNIKTQIHPHLVRNLIAYLCYCRPVPEVSLLKDRHWRPTVLREWRTFGLFRRRSAQWRRKANKTHCHC